MFRPADNAARPRCSRFPSGTMRSRARAAPARSTRHWELSDGAGSAGGMGRRTGALGGWARSAPLHQHSLSWSSPETLEAVSDYACSPRVAVAHSGRATVAWNGGAPPVVYASPRSREPSSASTGTGLNVTVALGTVTGRFSAPVDVSAPGADVRGSPRVAVSPAGIAYVVWPQTSRYVWMVASATGGRFSPPRPLGIPPGA